MAEKGTYVLNVNIYTLSVPLIIPLLFNPIIGLFIYIYIYFYKFEITATILITIILPI